MPRPAKNHEAAADLADRLQQLRADHGEPPYKHIELWIYDAFGEHVSDESIRKAHTGEVDPSACDPELIFGLAAFYDVEVTELGPYAARRQLTLLTMTSKEARETLPDRRPVFHGLQSNGQLHLFAPAA